MKYVRVWVTTFTVSVKNKTIIVENLNMGDHFLHGVLGEEI